MKFKKLTLDESLFDDDFTLSPGTIPSEGDFDSYVDDDFSDPDYPLEDTPMGPKAGVDTGIADTIISLINDEWEAIRGYNNFADMLKGNIQVAQSADLEKMLPVIADIVNEENKHVGQLQELLKLISPNATSIEDGEKEGVAQIASSGNEWVNGRLKVETHSPIQATSNEQLPNEVDTTCTLYNVDDEF